MVQHLVWVSGSLLFLVAFGVKPAFSDSRSGTPLVLTPESAKVNRRATRSEERTAYNFPPPSRGDRFARRGLNLRIGIRGWRRFGGLVKRHAEAYRVDPLVVGAYIWLESGFDPRQDYARGKRRALGLGSVQAQDYPRYTRSQLLDPDLNVQLTVAEFAQKWRPHDMVGTVMDVWYPAWRRLVALGRPVPVIKSPEVYTQAIANRYHALREIDAHFPDGPRRTSGEKPRASSR